MNKHWRPDSDDFIANPFPHYEAIRKETNVFHSPSGDYVLLAYEDVRSVLMNKKFKSGVRTHWMDKAVAYAQKKGKDYSSIQKVMGSMLLQFNPPDHTDIRTFLSRNWPSKAELQAKSQEVAKDLIHELPLSGNLVDQLSRRLPLKVVNHILGTHHFLSDQYITDSILILRTLDPYLTVKDLEAINEASIRLYQSFEEFYEELDGTEDNLSAQIKTFHDQSEVDFDPVSLILFLFISGLDTTSGLITSILQVLIENRHLTDQLTSDRRKENLVHEVLRLQSPVQLTGRINEDEISIKNVIIPPNSVITLCIGAANRDATQFENPHDINLDRDQHHQLGFGYGIHHCLGNQMALVESKAMVDNMLPIIDRLSLVDKPIFDTRLSLRNIHVLNYRLNGA